MKNIVTFETARRLKEAGFPQPGMAYFTCFFYDENGEMWRPGHLTLNPDIFAPTATDILEQLPSKWSLRHYDLEGEPVFSCAEKDADIYMNPNPAEAAALAWLAINEKQ
ncbi:MAG: hypothetical protein OHK0019_00600 [Saprospiraceae bacterium]